MGTTTKQRPLSGAAKNAQTRRTLIDEARAATADGSPSWIAAALLIRADRLTPRRTR